MRSLSPELPAQAVLLDKVPSDVVTANRTVVSDGDRVVPLSGIWRDERFPDAVEQAKLQRLSDSIDETAGLGDADHGAVAHTTAPKGVAAAGLEAEQRDLLRALLGTYLDRVPESVSPIRRYDDDSVLDSVHIAWAGPLEPVGPATTASRGPGLLVEWDNTQRGANHAHSVCRDPTSDFGLEAPSRHRAAHHR